MTFAPQVTALQAKLQSQVPRGQDARVAKLEREKAQLLDRLEGCTGKAVAQTTEHHRTRIQSSLYQHLPCFFERHMFVDELFTFCKILELSNTLIISSSESA